MLGDNIVDTLQQQLNSEDNKKYYRYLLIDMLGVTSELSELYPQQLKQLLPPKNIEVVKRPELLHELTSCPHLVCIGHPNQDVNTDLLFSSMVQVGEDFLTTKPYICGWLVAQQTIDEIAQWLPKIGLILGEMCSMRFVPFYEPFRMQLLQDSQLTDPNWINVFFPTNLTYYYIDIQQKLRVIEPNKDNQLLPSSLPPKIRFFQKESNNLFRLYVNWYDIKEEINQTVGENDLITLIEHYYTASLLGLTDIKDRTIYVFYSMQYGDLQQHEKISAIIDDVALQSPGTLSEQFLAINSTFQALLKNNKNKK
ncbi:hypothetical protein [Gilliamella sp. Occ4-3]|uniref:hypothetical protein n=1 Tax=Gilliamella sp. Occ4-3 TaxID=3120254 RepID=UPI00117ACA90|nr:hypothetical protein [Gilliamella apicola]MCO6557741.1 hypothetical protein [Gilliamella sp.]